MIGGKKGSGILNGFLDRGARFEGTLFFEDTFRIDGVLKGKVVSQNELIIGDGAAIDAEIHVGRLSVSGNVRGVVYARERIEVHANESVFLPVGAVHRIENCGTDMLKVIEVRVGEYLGEDDIIRLEDDWARDSG